jgi:predicted TIM-barrel fold metal-dependent hydrolase
MSKNEKEIELLELEFVKNSSKAFADAANEAKQMGLSNVVAIEGKVYSVDPDGTTHFIKAIEPPTPIKPGTTFRIK